MIPRFGGLPEISVCENRYDLRGVLEGFPSLPYLINNLRGNNASISAYTKPLGLRFIGFLLLDKKDDVARLNTIAERIYNSMKEIDQLSSVHETDVKKESGMILNRAYRILKDISEKELVAHETEKRIDADQSYQELIGKINTDSKLLTDGFNNAFPETITFDGIEVERGAFPDIDYDQLDARKGRFTNLWKTSLDIKIPASYIAEKKPIEPPSNPLIWRAFCSADIEGLVVNLGDYGAELKITRKEHYVGYESTAKEHYVEYKITANAPDKFDVKAINLLADVMYRPDSDEWALFKCFVKTKLKKRNSDVA